MNHGDREQDLINHIDMRTDGMIDEDILRNKHNQHLHQHQNDGQKKILKQQVIGEQLKRNVLIRKLYKNLFNTIVSFFFIEIVQEPVMIARHNNVRKNLPPRVVLGNPRHVRQQNKGMNHEIVVVVVHRHLVTGVDQMKIIVGVHERKHV